MTVVLTWSDRPFAAARVLAVLVALAAFLGLLLAFGRVVKLGVAQGAARQAASAEQAQAAWRCSLIANRDQRLACRAEMP